jgi:hypothetical protein
LSRVRRHVARAGPRRCRLVSADGEAVEIPADVLTILHEVTSALMAGDGVAVSPVSPELTLAEAARLTGASRADVIARVPSHRVGYQRRFHLPDVLRVLPGQGASDSENLPLP